MIVTNKASGTTIDDIEDRIYRINTPVTIPGAGGFGFNQYLVVDDQPLLFHTGPRKLFPLVREAVDCVIPAKRLKYIAFSHLEADECGSLNEWLAAAPQSVAVCSALGAMVSVNDLASRAPKGMAHGERLSLGAKTVEWIDAPHLPHGWDSGYLFEHATRTLFCGDLFTQGGTESPALTEDDILGPSEAFRASLDYYAHAPDTAALIERLAATDPRTLACMHGSAWCGDGAALLRELARRVAR